MAGLDPQLRLELAEPLLADPVRAVRLDAARVLAPVQTLGLPADRRARLDAAYAEYETAQSQLVERPEGLVTLANFYRERGRMADAEARLRDSIRLHPGFTPAYGNLADLLRQQDRDQEGEAVLAAGLAIAPASADLHHANGLWLIRRQQYREAVAELGRAAELAPENPRYAYVYAVALQETGRAGDAVPVLEAALRRHPTDPDLLFTLAAILLQRRRLRRCEPLCPDAGARSAGLSQRAGAAASRDVALSTEVPCELGALRFSPPCCSRAARPGRSRCAGRCPVSKKR